ncbi:MAG: hypothetical protein ACXABJ_05455 [Candidatus Heimdallarchaeaceae archaeon]|jgi:hypothetical protein
MVISVWKFKETFLIVILFLTSLFISKPIEISAEENYLITRIIDAEFPPTIKVVEKTSVTGFSFNIDYQVVNPTQSNITISMGCDLYPYPHLDVNLKDKSLEVGLLVNYNWIVWQTDIPPGVWNDSYKFEFIVKEYVKAKLPKGNYTIWFDFTNCSFCPVPVITEKLVISVSSTKITYSFEYNNGTIEVESLRKKYYSVFILFIPIMISVIIFRMRKNTK